MQRCRRHADHMNHRLLSFIINEQGAIHDFSELLTQGHENITRSVILRIHGYTHRILNALQTIVKSEQRIDR
jgi:hypothetical protein